MSYFKLIRRLPIFSDVSLVIIDRIAKSEARAKAYQVEHYRKTGEILEIKTMLNKGIAIVSMIEIGGLNKEFLLTVVESEKEARSVLKSYSIVFPFLQPITKPLNDISLSYYFLGGNDETH
ncbi:hypothetical protein [Gallibacterium sp. ZY190522]